MHFPSNRLFRVFVKKNSSNCDGNFRWLFSAAGATKELKKIGESIAIHYDLNRKHVKKYTYDNFNNCGLAKSSIYDIMARFDMDPILKMFDHLKAKIRKADQDGLRSLTKK